MKERGWRLNGQQYPSALHMCVTGPQTQAGVVEKFRGDLAESVTYAKHPTNNIPRSGSLYGGAGMAASPDDIDLVDLRALLIGALETYLEQPDSLEGG